MTPVPGVVLQLVVEGLQAALRMLEGALEIRRSESGKEPGPPDLKPFDEPEGRLHVQAHDIPAGGPIVLVVGLDPGPVLRDGKLAADESVHVAVSEVVRELAHGPTAGPVGCVELLSGETSHRASKLAGEVFEIPDPRGPLLGRDIFIIGESPDRVLEIFHA